MTKPRGDGTTLSVIGTGYLGAVHAACMAELGHNVIAVDTDPQRVRSLARGKAPFFEPELDELLVRVLATGRLRFTTEYAALAQADIHFICVGTPSKEGGHEADISFLLSAIDALAPFLRPGALVVGKSTVPVGTADVLRDRLARLSPSVGAVRLAWQPEFLREGHAIEDTMLPNRLVYGVTGASAAEDVRLLDLVYAQPLALGVPRLVTDLPTAELVKVAANAFLATKISFINAMSDLCDASGADIVELADALGMDDRIGRKFLGAGLGFGGGCLPKDVRAFAVRADELGAAHAAEWMRHVDRINISRRNKVVDLARSCCGGSLLGKRVAVLGAAFKPGSDDIRDSAALHVASAVRDVGGIVTVHDPKAVPVARDAYPELNYEERVLDACVDADLVLHLTEWREYQALDPVAMSDVVASRVMIDARNALDAGRWQSAGWRFVGLGRHTRRQRTQESEILARPQHM